MHINVWQEFQLWNKLHLSQIDCNKITQKFRWNRSDPESESPNKRLRLWAKTWTLTPHLWLKSTKCRAGTSLSELRQYSGEAQHQHSLQPVPISIHSPLFLPPFFNSKSIELLTGSGEILVYYNSGGITLKVGQRGISSRAKWLKFFLLLPCLKFTSVGLFTFVGPFIFMGPFTCTTTTIWGPLILVSSPSPWGSGWSVPAPQKYAIT